MTQQNNQRSPNFLERTDALAAHLGISLNLLIPMTGLSPASFWGYRSGKIPVSLKSWKKLEKIEEESGVFRKTMEDVGTYQTKRQDQKSMEERMAKLEAEVTHLKMILDRIRRAWSGE